MRKRAQRNFTRMSLSVLAALMAVAAFSGCGGGGGGGTPSGTTGGGINGNQGGTAPQGPLNASVADVTGKVVDSSNGQGVAGVTISIPGSTPVTTRSDGSFEVRDVPPGATSFTVTIPNTGTYATGLVSYNNAEYNLDDKCTLPLPALTAGQTVGLAGNISLFNLNAKDAAGNPASPPPPPNGCF
jgi:hypothetical protein